MSRPPWFGRRATKPVLIFLISVTFALIPCIPGVGTEARALPFFRKEDAPRESLRPRLDPRGPYLILSTEQAARRYQDALAVAKALHPTAATATFAPGDWKAAGKLLSDDRPRYVLLFILPEELDVNFAWRWLTLCTKVNGDPLVDARTGFITGRTPEDAASFMKRIKAVVEGPATLPGKLIDDLGPDDAADKAGFFRTPGNLLAPALGRRVGLETISHGAEGFTDERLAALDGAGLVHFGGHGHPDRVDDGVRAAQAARLRLSPCVVFNGACYTGVTGRWYDQWTRDGKTAEAAVEPADSFCLNLLRTSAVAYLAALHPDHGIPVYQEMEYLAYTGAPLGDVMKHTHDGVVLGSGGRLPPFERLAAGAPAPQWTAADVMLKGTASRVLFGDPSLIVVDAFTEAPFKVTTAADGSDALRVTATLANPRLKSTLTDTYHADLSRDQRLFNDRAVIEADLPEGWSAVAAVEVIGVTANGKPLESRLVGYAVGQEEAGQAGQAGQAGRAGRPRRLYVQVDLPADGYMRSAFRVAGATVELKVKRWDD